MLDTSPFTDSQWSQMVSNNMTMPVPLHTANLDNPFVYDRQWGLFYVGSGYHWQAMAMLLSFRNGFDDPYLYARSLDMECNYNAIHKLADKFLEQEGTCFASSMDVDTITVGKRGNLNAAERQALRNYPFRYIEDKS